MAEITTDARNQLKSSQFGLPASRKYPMPDRAHAANAKSRATQMVNRGKLAAATAATIKAKANRILGKKRTGVDQDINAPGNQAPSPLQNDINNWKSKPNTARPKWTNNSQASGKASRTGEATVRDGKQPKFGATDGGIRRGRNTIDSMGAIIRDH